MVWYNKIADRLVGCLKDNSLKDNSLKDNSNMTLLDAIVYCVSKDQDLDDVYIRNLSYKQKALLFAINSKSSLDLNWPVYGGFDLSFLRTFDNPSDIMRAIGKNNYWTDETTNHYVCAVSRIGPLRGISFSIETRSDGNTKYFSESERSILYRESKECHIGTFDLTLYSEIAKIFAEAKNLENLKENLEYYLRQNNLMSVWEKVADEKNVDLDQLIESYYKSYKWYKEESSTMKDFYADNYKAKNPGVNVDYGIFGEAAEWTAAGTSGGANQVTAIFDLATLADMGIYTNDTKTTIGGLNLGL